MNLPIKLVKTVVTQEASGNWPSEPTVTKYPMFAELVQPSSAFRSYDAQTQLGQVKTFRVRFNFDLHPTGDWKIEFRGKEWTIQGMPLKDDRQFYWLITANFKG